MEAQTIESPKTEKLFSWDVEEKNIMVCGGKKILNRKATVRSDNKDVLGVVGTGYEVVLNSEVELVAKTIIQNRNFTNPIVKEIDGGAINIVQIEMPEALRVGDDKVTEFLTLVNSHNGRTTFNLGMGNRVLSCANQFYYFNKKSNYRIPHTRSAMDTIQAVLQSIDLLHEQRMTLNKTFQDFTMVKLSDTRETARRMVQYIQGVDLEISQAKLKEDFNIGTNLFNKAVALENNILTEIDQKGKNLWGLFNGVTFYTNHTLKTADVDKNLAFGTAKDINMKALEYCKALVG